MRSIYSRCAGLDVHKKTVVACRLRVEGPGEVVCETRTFGTMTAELLTLVDWLVEWEVTHVTMESTGDYWKPIFNLLEGNFEVLLVNAQHVKHVPGRKTDVADAEWLAELLSCGLLKASFIPPKPQRDVRDLTRYRRTLVEERARLVNRVQKLLETANIKLSSVATDVLGVSGRAMLRALAAGERDSQALAELARGKLRKKIPQLQQALRGVVDEHHSYLLAQQLAHIDFLDEQIADISQEIARRLEAMSPPPSPSAPPLPAADQCETPLRWMEAVALLDTAPGIDERAAQAILAEIGLDMRQFPTPAHLASWAGLAPGNHQSGGKRYSGRTHKGNHALRTTLVQAAWAAVRKKSSYVHSLYHRLAARRGKKRALVAVAHSLLCSIHVMLSRKLPYIDLGADYFDRRRKPFKVDWLVDQLAKLGYVAAIQPLPSTA
jgi:transposase